MKQTPVHRTSFLLFLTIITGLSGAGESYGLAAQDSPESSNRFDGATVILPVPSADHCTDCSDRNDHGYPAETGKEEAGRSADDATELPRRPWQRDAGRLSKPGKDKPVPLEFVPSKLYAQVRGTRTVKRLPRREAIASAETEEEKENAARLREVVTNSKVNTVYTEEGYEDSAYDHAGQIRDADFHEGYARKVRERMDARKRTEPGSDESPDYEDDYRDDYEGAATGERTGNESSVETPSGEDGPTWIPADHLPKLITENGIAELRKDAADRELEATAVSSELNELGKTAARPVESAERESLEENSPFVLSDEDDGDDPIGKRKQAEEEVATPVPFALSGENLIPAGFEPASVREFYKRNGGSSSSINSINELANDKANGAEVPSVSEESGADEISQAPESKRHRTATFTDVARTHPAQDAYEPVKRRPAYKILVREKPRKKLSESSEYEGSEERTGRRRAGESSAGVPGTLERASPDENLRLSDKYARMLDYIRNEENVRAGKDSRRMLTEHPFHGFPSNVPGNGNALNNGDPFGSRPVYAGYPRQRPVVNSGETADHFGPHGFDLTEMRPPAPQNAISYYSFLPPLSRGSVAIEQPSVQVLLPALPIESSVPFDPFRMAQRRAAADVRTRLEIGGNRDGNGSGPRWDGNVQRAFGERVRVAFDAPGTVRARRRRSARPEPDRDTDRRLDLSDRVKAAAWRKIAGSNSLRLAANQQPGDKSDSEGGRTAETRGSRNLERRSVPDRSRLGVDKRQRASKGVEAVARSLRNPATRVDGKNRTTNGNTGESLGRREGRESQGTRKEQRESLTGGKTGGVRPRRRGSAEEVERSARSTVSRSKRAPPPSPEETHQRLLDYSAKITNDVIEKEINDRFNKENGKGEGKRSREEKVEVEVEAGIGTEIFDEIAHVGEELEDEAGYSDSSSTTTDLPTHLDSNKYPFYGSADLSPTSAVKYASNPRQVPRKSAGGTEFYDSRDSYKRCEQVEPKLDRAVPRHPEPNPDQDFNQELPRLRGLGEKLDCFKQKYFDQRPFDNPLFLERRVEDPLPPVELNAAAVAEFSERILSLPRENDRYVVQTVSKKPESEPRHGSKKPRSGKPYEGGVGRDSIRLGYHRQDPGTGRGRNAAHLHTVRTTTARNPRILRPATSGNPRHQPAGRSSASFRSGPRYQNEIYADVMGNIEQLANLGSTTPAASDGAVKMRAARPPTSPVNRGLPQRGKETPGKPKRRVVLRGIPSPAVRSVLATRYQRGARVRKRSLTDESEDRRTDRPKGWRVSSSERFAEGKTEGKRGGGRSLVAENTTAAHRQPYNATAEEKGEQTRKVVYTIRDRIRHSKPKEEERNFAKFAASPTASSEDPRRNEPKYNSIKRKRTRASTTPASAFSESDRLKVPSSSREEAEVEAESSRVPTVAYGKNESRAGSVEKPEKAYAACEQTVEEKVPSSTADSTAASNVTVTEQEETSEKEVERADRSENPSSGWFSSREQSTDREIAEHRMKHLAGTPAAAAAEGKEVEEEEEEEEEAEEGEEDSKSREGQQSKEDKPFAFGSRPSSPAESFEDERYSDLGARVNKPEFYHPPFALSAYKGPRVNPQHQTNETAQEKEREDGSLFRWSEKNTGGSRFHRAEYEFPWEKRRRLEPVRGNRYPWERYEDSGPPRDHLDRYVWQSGDRDSRESHSQHRPRMVKFSSRYNAGLPAAAVHQGTAMITSVERISKSIRKLLEEDSEEPAVSHESRQDYSQENRSDSAYDPPRRIYKGTMIVPESITLSPKRQQGKSTGGSRETIGKPGEKTGRNVEEVETDRTEIPSFRRNVEPLETPSTRRRRKPVRNPAAQLENAVVSEDVVTDSNDRNRSRQRFPTTSATLTATPSDSPTSSRPGRRRQLKSTGKLQETEQRVTSTDRKTVKDQTKGKRKRKAKPKNNSEPGLQAQPEKEAAPSELRGMSKRRAGHRQKASVPDRGSVDRSPLGTNHPEESKENRNVNLQKGVGSGEPKTDKMRPWSVEAREASPEETEEKDGEAEREENEETGRESRGRYLKDPEQRFYYYVELRK